MKRFILTIFAAFSLTIAGGALLNSSAVYAQNTDELCGGANLELSSGSCDGGDEGTLNDLIATIVNVLSVIIGVIAVIMIIVGGFKFITSGGDAGKVSSAKTTVVYALVGLIIVALAQVIVRFVLSSLD